MAQMDLRVGLGTDLHRLAAGRRLVLGGVEVESELGCVGHSDGDVLLHAVTDALLGGAGLGDIGEWFPDTDPQWKNADSADLLGKVIAAIRERGWQVGNLDCVISAEKPKLSPYKERIQKELADLLDVPAEAVNVKAKTGEGLGPIGESQAIAAQVIVLLVRASPSTE